MRITDDYVFFYKSKLGQWTNAPMMVEGVLYNCCEQYMMYQKALLFDDLESAQLILKESKPKRQQDLGRLVRNFDQEIWDANAKRIVYEGNFAKFTQYKELKELLLTFGERKFVEASPIDLVWGVGYKEDDILIDNAQNWKGKNWLGEVLTQLRDDLYLLGKNTIKYKWENYGGGGYIPDGYILRKFNQGYMIRKKFEDKYDSSKKYI